MSIYQSIKYWSERDISTSSAPVVMKNEMYVIHINEGIQCFDMDEDHLECESKELVSQFLGVKNIGYDFLLKNADDEIRLFWTTENFELKAVKFKNNRDETLHSPLELAPGSRVLSYGKEGDDEPFSHNSTMVYRVKWHKRESAPTVEYKDLVSEYKYSVRFPKWGNSRGAEGNNEFFLAKKKLFGVDMRHLSVCSIEVDGHNYEEHDLRVPPELILPIQYQKMVISVDGDNLYIAYSGPIDEAPICGRLRKRRRYFGPKSQQEPKSDPNVENPMVLRINLNTFEVDRLTLIWPDGEHKPSHSCRITVDDEQLYLMGFCTELVASQMNGRDNMVECKETHIYRFDMLPLPESAQSQTEYVSVQELNSRRRSNPPDSDVSDGEPSSSSLSRESPPRKQKRITESEPELSDSELPNDQLRAGSRSPDSSRTVSSCSSLSPTPPPSPKPKVIVADESDQPGPALRCSDCRIVLNSSYISDQFDGNFCYRCFERQETDNEIGYERRVSSERVLSDVDSRVAEAEERAKEMERTIGKLLETHDVTMQAIRFAGEDLTKMAKDVPYVKEEIVERHQAALAMFMDQQRRMLQIVKEAVDDADIPVKVKKNNGEK